MKIINEYEELVEVGCDMGSKPHCYTLDMANRDFTLTPLLVVEETTTETLTFEVGGGLIEMPTCWSVLVFSTETSQLDVMSACEISAMGSTTAFGYGVRRPRVKALDMVAVDYSSESTIAIPSLRNTFMLCHPIDQDTFIVIGKSDGYNRYLKGALTGDLI